jgi:putative intracellular protease/amidase
VFTDANKLCGGSAYEVEIVSGAEDRSVPTQIGVPILARRSYRELRGTIDTLLVGGGEWSSDKQHSPDFLRWISEQSTKVRRLGSVCTGALVLADAGAEWTVRDHPLALVQRAHSKASLGEGGRGSDLHSRQKHLYVGRRYRGY